MIPLAFKTHCVAKAERAVWARAGIVLSGSKKKKKKNRKRKARLERTIGGKKKKRAALDRFGSVDLLSPVFVPTLSLSLSSLLSLLHRQNEKVRHRVPQKCSILQAFVPYQRNAKRKERKKTSLFPLHLTALAAKPRPPSAPLLLTPLLSTSCSGLITLGPLLPGT